MLRFPCLLFKENKIVHSREELIDRLNEAKLVGKNAEVGIYAFSQWYNLEPIEESVIIDKVVYTGSQDKLEALAERKLKEGIPSTLIFDGEDYLLFVMEEKDSLEELYQIKEEGVKTITDVRKKFVFPGYPNLKNGRLSKIIKKWRVE